MEKKICPFLGKLLIIMDFLKKMFIFNVIFLKRNETKKEKRQISSCWALKFWQRIFSLKKNV